MQVIATPGGADAGTFQLRVTGTDAHGASISDEFEIVVLDANVAPVLVNPPQDVQALEGEELLIALPATMFADSDLADSLSVAARLEDGSALPHWLTFDPATFTLSGTPHNEDVGATRVRIIAVDPAGASSAALFTINVQPVNDAPIATGTLGEQAVLAGDVVDYVVPAGAFLELDSGDSLAFSAEMVDGSALPGWLAFDASNRRFSGVAQGNGRLDIRVTATDEAGASASSLLGLGVTGGDGNAPVLAAPLQDQSALEDSPFVFVIPGNAFTDEGGALLYSAQDLPGWLSFDPGTRRFSGTPVNSDVGQHDVRVVATDDTGLSADDTFVISVINTNDAPTVEVPLEERSVDAGSPFILTLPANTFADVDAGDSLVLSAKLFDGSALPVWLSFDAASGTFSGNPKQANIGLSHVVVTGTDAAGASASADFGLVVRAAAGSAASGGAGDDLLYGNEGDETLKAKGGSDYLYGNAGDDLLRGGAGSDVLQGGDGNDVLRGGTGQNLLDGGWGDDVLYGGQGSSFLAGGAGNDVLHVGRGHDVIAFNAGDGVDTVFGGRDGGNTISLGGAIDYGDLTLSKEGKDLVLGVGDDDKLVLKNWYSGTKSVLDLQIVADAVERFDFLELVNAYDAARAETPGLTSWALTNALLQFHLSTSNDEAIGGDLAHWYGKTGTFDGLSLAAAQGAIGAAGFGAEAQALRPFAGLQEGFAKLA
jgi:Ca2+-binding RTX toxin-like protein